jgi:hypothetical protein
MNLPSPELSPLQRRALINAGLASLTTLVVGLSVLAVARGGDEGGGSIASPTGATSPSPRPPACEPTWEVVGSANPGDLPADLRDLTVIAASEAWAVGSSGDPESPDLVLIERWDGSAWTAEQGPSPGSETNELLSVDSSEPNDVWAVGRTASGFGDRPLILHFDGSEWSVATPPSDVTGVLTGVAAVAPDDVWAVGFSGDPDVSLERAFVIHWDGASWTLAETGRALGNGRSALNDVNALSPDDVWAAGRIANRPLTIRSDGSRWTRIETEVPGVANAIEPVGPAEAWLVGSPIQRFDGTSWSKAANVRRDGVLASVASVSPTDVWAVGLRPGGEDNTRSLVLRWDGEGWHPVKGPGVPGSDALRAIEALPDGTILGVGYRDVEAGRRTLTIRGTTCVGS